MLSVKINRTEKVAEFSGDTFHHKDVIKSCGTAKWDATRKIWVVSQFTLSIAELNEVLPNVEVEEEKNVEESTSSKNDTLSNLPDSVSLVELVLKAERAIHMAFPQRLFVRATIAAVKKRHDGTMFLTLKSEEDEEQLIQAVIWSSEAQGIVGPLKEKGFDLEENLAVMFGVQVKFRRQRAELSLVVHTVVPEYTIAKLLAQRDKTNEQLKKEGIFSNNKDLELCFLPKKLGLVTSKTGTVIHDFRKALDKSAFGFELLWCHASVQGEAAVGDIIKAIKTLEAKKVDAILVFRGGGSSADLAVFNDYSLAKTVCLCSVPVLSAIGHQEDQSSVQDVSYHVEGVPQGLGRFFAQRVIDFRQDVKNWARSIVNKILSISTLHSHKLESKMSSILNSSNQISSRTNIEIQNLAKSICRESLRESRESARKTDEQVRVFLLVSQQIVRNTYKTLDRYPDQIKQISKRFLSYRTERLESLGRLVNSSSPKVQMQRGFALIRGAKTDKYKTRAEQLAKGEEIEVEFFDNVAKAKVITDKI